MTEFGQNLQRLRRQAGLSQQQLADRLNVSRQAVSKWELGAAKPDIDNLVQIGALFSVSIDELLTGGAADDRTAQSELRRDDRMFWIRALSIVLTALGIAVIVLAVLCTPLMQKQEMAAYGECFTNPWVYLRHFPLGVVLWIGIGCAAAGIALFVHSVWKTR